MGLFLGIINLLPSSCFGKKISIVSSIYPIADLVNLWRDDTGNLPAMPAIYPDYPAPVVTQEEGGRVMRMMRWGMPSPAFALKGKKTDKGVTNVRNTASPHWRRWLVPPGQMARIIHACDRHLFI